MDWIKIGLAVLDFLRKVVAAITFAQAKEAGRDEAIVAGQKREDDALAGTQAAIDEADKKPIEYRD